MKILITGGAGFIGRTLAARLVASGHHVVALDTLTPQIHGEIPAITLADGVEFVREDVRNLAARPELLEGVDAVYHLAAETGTGQSMYRIAHYVDVNEMGTAALLEAIARCERRPRKLVLASSRAIYGEGAYVDPRQPDHILHPDPRTAEQLARGEWAFRADDGTELNPTPTPEWLPPKPGSVYAATKMSQEMLVATACSGMGVQTTLLRFQNVFGEGQSLRNPYSGIVSIFFNRARQGLPIHIYEDGRISRDFVHVTDVARACELALVAETADKAVYNVGSGVPTDISEVTKILLAEAGVEVPIIYDGQFRLGDIRHCVADLTAIRRDMGYEPGVTVEAGLQRFAAWAREQGVYDDRLDAATAELRSKGLGKK